MATIKMKYGNEYVDVTVPDENLAGVIESNANVTSEPESDIIERALTNPIGSPRLKDIVKPGETACVVVSDITRLWQRMSVFLPYIISELGEGGVKDKDIIFVSATGYHRAQSLEEHKQIFGQELAKRIRIIDHDCYDQENLVNIGTTSFGTRIEINKFAHDCDHIILTGCVGYHPLSGWSGGRKSLLPGIAGYDSIQANHALGLAPELGAGKCPNVRNGNFAGNRLHEDMTEAAVIAKPSFLFNVIMGSNGRIAHAVAGDHLEAHQEACDIVETECGIEISELADLVICTPGGYPKDIDLYQSGKAIYNALEALKPDSAMIVLAQCAEGLGDEHVNRMFKEFDSTFEREKEVRREFTVTKFISFYISECADKAEIIVVGDLDPKDAENANIKVVGTLDEALDLVYSKRGRDLRTYLMPQAPSTLPKYTVKP